VRPHFKAPPEDGSWFRAEAEQLMQSNKQFCAREISLPMQLCQNFAHQLSEKNGEMNKHGCWFPAIF
jgi:hypothetical protein